MNLLTDKVFETDNSIKLMNILCKTLTNRVDGKFCVSQYITYNDFRIMLHTFIVEIMCFFLEDTKYSDDTYDVYFKKLSRNVSGEFNTKDNTLVINDDVIKRIYDGKLDDLVVIFHELNHFKVKYELRSGVINEDTCRILKEKFIRQDDRESTNEIGKILKGKRIYIDDFYYDDNYMNYSEEVIVRIRASKDMILFSKMLVILGNLNNRSSAFKLLDNILEDMISADRVRYDNHIRDLRMNMMFNSNYLDFDEAFDFLVKYNPQWLECPQIGIEYYIDGDNKVKKKDSIELYKLLDETSDEDMRKYIELLISKIEKKTINTNIR